MQITFEHIKNKLSGYYILDILHATYNYLDYKSDQIKPVWTALTLIKWSYLYSAKSYPVKLFTDSDFKEIFDTIFDFNSEYISSYIKSGNVNKAFAILHYQQFYLQTVLHTERFATQLKIYDGLKSKYDISVSFKNKTGMSINDFITMMQLTWLSININIKNKRGLIPEGYITQDFIDIASQISDTNIVYKFIKQLSLHPRYVVTEIKKWNGIRKEEWQTMEKSFFTIFPFQYFNKGIKMIHKSIFNYSANYYIYDFLKINDKRFTEEFGARFEKYIELGLIEINANYITETEIKKLLPEKHKVVDFKVEDNIFIECKAIEAKAYASINPTDDVIYNSFKDSILKAYYSQLYDVSKTLNGNNKNWGIILTYKDFFWNQFTDLFEFTKDKYPHIDDYTHIPPENVFIIDIHTWDKIINVIKTGQTDLMSLLLKARNTNKNPETRKQQFDMHLDDFDINQFQLSYLTEETKSLEISQIRF